MESSADCLVLGAGISGLALAYHLGRRGIRASVYDPRTPSAGATGRSAGVLTEQLWDPWDVEVVRETRREYSELAARYSPRSYVKNGFVRIASDPVALGLLDEAVPRWRSWGVEVEELSSSELGRRIPAGSFEDGPRGVYTPHDAVVEPSSIAASYAEAARKGGVTFDFGRPMTSLRRRGEVWELMTRTGSLGATSLVVAAGAWSKSILRSLGHRLPMAPYRTQAAVLRPSRRVSEDSPTVHDLDSDVYMRPESDGRLLVGDGTESVESDPEAFRVGGDAEFLAHLAETLAVRFPGYRDAEVAGSWAGLCTATPDRRPLIGEVPDAPGLYVIAGFNGFGIMRAGGCARRLADLISDGESASEPLSSVRPSRFHGTTPDFSPRPGFTVEGGDDPRF